MIRWAAVVPHPPLLVPAIGRGQENLIPKIQEAYRRLATRVASLKPTRIVLISSHVPMSGDAFHIPAQAVAHGDFAPFGHPEVSFAIENDTEYVLDVYEIAEECGLPLVSESRPSPMDHATLVPLWFLREAGVAAPVVRVAISDLPLSDHKQLGKILAQADRPDDVTVVIASGDLSHRLKEDGPYGFREEGPEYDARVTADLARGDFFALTEYSHTLLSKAGECGHRTFVILGGMLEEYDMQPSEMVYEGPFGVGYAVCEYEILGKTEKQSHPYVIWARSVIEATVRGEAVPDLPESFPYERAAVFVTLNKGGQLRGCIGTLEPRESHIADEIRNNAISAALHDPRFPSVREEELPLLDVSVDVLSDPEPVDSMDELDPKKYGVIVTSGYKRGVLLPDLEGVDTVEYQVDIASQKAGIRPGEVRHLQRFTVTRYV